MHLMRFEVPQSLLHFFKKENLVQLHSYKSGPLGFLTRKITFLNKYFLEPVSKYIKKFL